MLSRIADSMYWMARYLERADNTARLLEINLLHLVEAEDSVNEAAQWRPLLAIAGAEESYEECYGTKAVTGPKVIRFLTQETCNTNSIRSCIRSARENARTVRDRISREMWEVMNDLWLGLDARLKTDLAPERATDFYGSIRDAVAHFHGETVATMMRGEAFSFYLLGTFLERADMTARIVDVKYHLLLPDISLVGSPLDYYQWQALLKSLSGYEPYRRLYHTGLRPLDLWQFVVFEKAFPRSLRFSLDHMATALHMIDPDCQGEGSCQALQELLSGLDEHTPDSSFTLGPHEFLEQLLDRIERVHGALVVDYFQSQMGDWPCAS